MKSIIKRISTAVVLIFTVLAMFGCKTSVTPKKSICCLQVEDGSSPYKRIYKLGEAFDRSNLIVRIHYKDNTFEETDDWTYSGFDSSSPVNGLTVRIKYKTVETFITVNIVSDEVFPYTVPEFLAAIGPNVQTITSDPKTPGITLSEDGLTANISNVILTGNFVYPNSSKGIEGVSMPTSLVTVDLSGIDMSETVTDGMFYENENNLETLIFPSKMEKLGESICYNCKNLKNVTLPQNLTTVGQLAFGYCKSITEIVLPDSVTSIGPGGFGCCYNLTSINLPEGLTTIERIAFTECKSLTSITIPSTVTEIGLGAFAICEGLTAVNIKDLKQWTSFDFSFPKFSPLYYAHHLYLNGVEVTGNLVLDNSITSIGSYTFVNLEGIESVEFPEGLTYIGEGAFYGTNITSIDIPQSVTCIGYNAFPTEKITAVNISNLSKWFSIDLYGDNDFASKLYLNGVEVSYDNEIVLDNSITKIGSYAFAETDVKKVKIPSTITKIGDGAFRKCTSLESLEIPSGVTEIGKNAFDGCTGLTSVNIPENVTKISEKAFYNCSNITSIEIPSGVTELEECAFYSCSSLNMIKIPATVKSIGKSTFAKCFGITSINLPDTVTSIGEYAFDYCSGLKTINIPSGVTVIEKYTFNHCEALTSITIPSGVTKIGNAAFQSCTGLTSITIPNTVTEIENYGFSLCSKASPLNVPSSVTTIGENAFQLIPKVIYNGTAEGSPWGAKSVVKE